MQNYSTPCYTLEEARQILGIYKSELEHEIRAKNITLVAYTKLRSMLLFLRNEDGSWEGLASCTYRGHLSFTSEFILKLLDQPTITLGAGSCLLLDVDGISNWSMAYPFKRPIPHLPIASWNPIEIDRAIGVSRAIAKRRYEQQLSIANAQPIDQTSESSFLVPIGQHRPIAQRTVPLYGCAATPCPVEFESMSEVFIDWLDKLEAIKDTASMIGAPRKPKTLKLDFNKNSQFSYEDLRIPASEINRYKAAVEDRARAEKIAQLLPPASQTVKRRGNQLHMLINRILDSDSSISAKLAWKLIQADVDLDSPLFDTDNILQAVDDDCIEWRSRYGVDQSITWASFQPLLAKLKRKRTNEF